MRHQKLERIPIPVIGLVCLALPEAYMEAAGVLGRLDRGCGSASES